jgi:hypothetical protein
MPAYLVRLGDDSIHGVIDGRNSISVFAADVADARKIASEQSSDPHAMWDNATVTEITADADLGLDGFAVQVIISDPADGTIIHERTEETSGLWSVKNVPAASLVTITNGGTGHTTAGVYMGIDHPPYPKVNDHPRTWFRNNNFDGWVCRFTETGGVLDGIGGINEGQGIHHTGRYATKPTPPYTVIPVDLSGLGLSDGTGTVLDDVLWQKDSLESLIEQVMNFWDFNSIINLHPSNFVTDTVTPGTMQFTNVADGLGDMKLTVRIIGPDGREYPDFITSVVDEGIAAAVLDVVIDRDRIYPVVFE